MGLDSIYAMLARPVKAVFQPKREVEQVKTSSAIAPDSHEAPQSQLPPEIDKRERIGDRRKEQKGFARERRKHNRRREDEAKNESRPQEEGKGQIIDIDV
ncbi:MULTISPECIES: hypothetical protein [Shewanella]|jgi:hypothetical protein|nr:MULTISPECIES: hypothetical protein [Shewanella]TVP08834.1 hypothetical protein AYI96_18235 [Shewanella sp. MSW]BCV38332.1 hypothetical protein TUM17377_36600 [Shewanella chilikensis]NDO75813.1 hypothetical protein [Shewanella sp. SE1]QWL05542.1 hypothetical protein JV206_16845 [Shewanella indica]GHB16568.1 hypothetical protein GCM10007107_31950 [Shewanella indica]